MLFKTQMQKSELLSIHKGWLQTQYNGVLYREFLDKFAGVECAINAKQFFEALGILDQDFYINITENKLQLIDSQQEFNLTIESLDEDVGLKYTQRWQMVDLLPLHQLTKFVTQDYPGLIFEDQFVEVIHPSMIVRINMSYSLIGVYSVPIFPSLKTGDMTTTKHGLWVKYTEHAMMCLGKLEQEKPGTDAYFSNTVGELGVIIPRVVKDRWVRCKKALFTKHGLLLDDHILIEGVEGTGEYDGVLLSKVIRNCTHWATDAELMYFRNEHITGVLENVEHCS